MTSWRVAGIVLLALITGCAVSPLRQAEKHIANQEYREALQVYMRSLNPTIRNGKRYISYEPETVTGIGVVLWHMKRYDTAVRILQSVVKRSPEYGKALFYLGACYESQKQLDKAQNAYALYTSVNPKDPYRDPIRWRLDWITRVKGSIDVRRATENEASIQLSSFSKESVAILYFQNLSQNTRWNPLQKGLAEMATIDLSQVDALKVIPRSRLEGVMRQLKLSVTGMMDDSRSLQVAKLLGARTLIKGSFRVYPDNKLEIRAGTLYVPESKMPDYVAFTGTVDRLPIIEKQLVRKILADLGVTPTPDQDRALAEVHTKDWRAFMAYAFGLDMLDQGNFASAQNYFGRAMVFDPLFSLARSMTVPLNLYQATHIQDIALTQAAVSRYLGEAVLERPEERLYTVNAASRLEMLGIQMDAGFIPNNDAREAYSEVQGQQKIELNLPAPPGLPFVPERWILPGPPAPPQRSR